MRVLKILKKELVKDGHTFPVYTGLLGDISKNKDGYYDFIGAYLIRDLKFMKVVTSSIAKFDLQFPLTIIDPIEITQLNQNGDYYYLPKKDKSSGKYILNSKGEKIYQFVVKDIVLKKVANLGTNEKIEYTPYKPTTAEDSLKAIEEAKSKEKIENIKKDIDNLPF